LRHDDSDDFRVVLGLPVVNTAGWKKVVGYARTLNVRVVDSPEERGKIVGDALPFTPMSKPQ
jgi:hypothetical protein